MAELKKQLDKKTLVKAWALTYSSEACYNYERLQALGNTNQMITVVRKLYDTEEEQVEALKKYMVFFNTEPSWMGTVIHGITISMEEQIANGAEITGEDVNALRTGLMGPMACLLYTSQGTELKIQAEGADEKEALDSVLALIRSQKD